MAVSEVRVAGALVSVVLSLYIESMFHERNKSHPQRHVLIVILGSLVTIPLLFLTSPAWYSIPMQITANALVLALDWFSFHEDKTRFSEENLCITGPCRRNAMITGHLAHWADVVGLMLLLLLNTDRRNYPAIVAGFLAYGVVGSVVIHRMTRDGSISDLRDLSEEEKCKQSRIMRDGWRGALNDLITLLGVMVAWQALYTCGDGRCKGFSAPLKTVKSMFTDSFGDADTKWKKTLATWRVVFSLAAFIVPTYANFVNTAAQHGQLPSKRYDLPTCFDD